MTTQKLTFTTPNGKYSVSIIKFEDEIHPHVYIRVKHIKHKQNYYTNKRKFPMYLIDQIEYLISTLI